jgi:hypothetical protein
MVEAAILSTTAHGIVVGILAGTTIVAAIVTGWVFRPARNGLDLQIPRSLAALRAAVGSTDEERRRNRNNIYADFGFLASYTALFVAAGSLLARQGPGWATVIGIAAIATGVLTGALDVLEDLTILQELRPQADLARLYPRVRGFSIPKWTLAAVTDLLLASFFAFGWWGLLGIPALAASAVSARMVWRALS